MLIKHYSLDTAHCLVESAHCLIESAHCLLESEHLLLKSEHWLCKCEHWLLESKNLLLDTAHWSIHILHFTFNTAHLTLLTGQHTLFTPFQLDLMWENSTHLLSPTIPDKLFALLQLALFITNYTLVFKLYWMYYTTKIIPNMVHFWEKEKNMACLFCLVLECCHF